MKIAQIAPLIERVPPKRYGGTERVVYALTEELVGRGHKVTLFASGDSKTSAKLISVYPRALREAKMSDIYGPNYFAMLNIGIAYKMQDQFDIIHDHNGHLSLPTANIANTPVVVTMHGVINTTNKKIFEMLNKPYLVSISKSQVARIPGINHIGTVYHGMNMGYYPFSGQSEGFLLFAGRISIEKGLHHAIEVAQNLNLPLIIAAKLESVDIPYFNEYIGPRLSEQIRWVGEVDEEERNKLMSKALCLLHPITWREPFGLTLIEAMACGCPVVAFNRGSSGEIIEDGKTGFVVEDIEEMITAIEKIDNIDRKYCRQYTLDRFNAARMAEGYEKVYRQIIQEKQLG